MFGATDDVSLGQGESLLARTRARCSEVKEYAFGFLPFSASGEILLTDRRIVFRSAHGRWEVGVDRLGGATSFSTFPGCALRIPYSDEAGKARTAVIQPFLGKRTGGIIDPELGAWAEKLETLREERLGPSASKGRNWQLGESTPVSPAWILLLLGYMAVLILSMIGIEDEAGRRIWLFVYLGFVALLLPAAFQARREREMAALPLGAFGLAGVLMSFYAGSAGIAVAGLVTLAIAAAWWLAFKRF